MNWDCENAMHDSTDEEFEEFEEEVDDEFLEPPAKVERFLARSSMHPFEALAEPARRRIVEVLASGEHTAGELAAVVGSEFSISRTAVSKHLRLLRDANLIDVRGDFQWRWYRLASFGLEVLELIVADLRHKWNLRVGWDEELGRENDPLAFVERPVPRKGPGPGIRRGHRGTQTTPPIASEPDLGW